MPKDFGLRNVLAVLFWSRFN